MKALFISFFVALSFSGLANYKDSVATNKVNADNAMVELKVDAAIQNHSINAVYYAPKKAKVRIYITNIMTQVYYGTMVDVVEGYNNIHLTDLPNIPAGSYYFHLVYKQKDALIERIQAR
jgi:hypothetical protein